jgi:ABC-2 type transport system permease protein
MIKTWRVALHEYRQHVFNKRFLLGLFSVPLLLLVMVGLIFLIFAMENNQAPIGYVDLSGILADPLPPPPVENPDRPVEFFAYPDEAAAMSALEAGEIQAFYVIPADYRTSGALRVVHLQDLKYSPRSQFEAFLSVNLLRDADPAVANRLIEASDVTVRSPDGSREMSSTGWFNMLLPAFAGMAFVIAMFTAGGYLMQAVVEEKENRTMEVLITSVSPGQFMAGKIIGDIAIGLTQIAVWLAFIAGGILIGRGSIDFLQGIQISPQLVLLVVVILFPAFVMVAALMAAIGATVSEAREGQQMTGLISLPVWIPFMLLMLIVESPNSPVVLFLSFFPLTAPLTILMRQSMTILPAWQIAVSAGIQILGAVGAVWLAGRAFRLGMLRYGKRLRWKEIFARA